MEEINVVFKMKCSRTWLIFNWRAQVVLVSFWYVILCVTCALKKLWLLKTLCERWMFWAMV